MLPGCFSLSSGAASILSDTSSLPKTQKMPVAPIRDSLGCHLPFGADGRKSYTRKHKWKSHTANFSWEKGHRRKAPNIFVEDIRIILLLLTLFLLLSSLLLPLHVDSHGFCLLSKCRRSPAQTCPPRACASQPTRAGVRPPTGMVYPIWSERCSNLTGPVWPLPVNKEDKFLSAVKILPADGVGGGGGEDLGPARKVACRRQTDQNGSVHRRAGRPSRNPPSMAVWMKKLPIYRK